ncbi:jg7488 [Pararge aegeria aegeria]|uniref:Jg7488 protein n=1 Tax=Pararge aegeria aegeria TaxID=348720 RepID=A0A8S4R7E2_9NEOP|nr:jg7488 [Pararge aegeria aegeria]
MCMLPVPPVQFAGSRVGKRGSNRGGRAKSSPAREMSRTVTRRRCRRAGHCAHAVRKKITPAHVGETSAFCNYSQEPQV